MTENDFTKNIKLTLTTEPNADNWINGKEEIELEYDLEYPSYIIEPMEFDKLTMIYGYS